MNSLSSTATLSGNVSSSGSPISRLKRTKQQDLESASVGDDSPARLDPPLLARQLDARPPRFQITTEDPTQAVDGDDLRKFTLLLCDLDWAVLSNISKTVKDFPPVWFDLDKEPPIEPMDVDDLLIHYDAVIKHDRRVHKRYLTHGFFVAFFQTPYNWQQEYLDLSIHHPSLMNDLELSKAIDVTKLFDDKVSAILQILPSLHARGDFGFDIKKALRLRVNLLKEMSDTVHDIAEKPRSTHSWPDIAMIMTPPIATESQSTSPATQDVQRPATTANTNLELITALTYLTFITNVLLALPLCTLGFLRSPSTPGTPTDADFWFLCQSGTAQLLGLLALALPTYQGLQRGKHWAAALLALGAIGALMAPVVYTHAPTGWASLMGAGVGAVQLFVTVEVAMGAEGRRKRGKVHVD